MASTWLEVKNNPKFAKETPETQQAIANDYFENVIAPKAKANGDDVEAIRADFQSKALTGVSNPETTQEKGTTQTPAPEKEKVYPVNTPPAGYNQQPEQKTPTNDFASQYAQSQQTVRNSLGGTDATVLPTGHQIAEHWRGMGSGAKYTLKKQASTITDWSMENLSRLSSDGDSAYSRALRNTQNNARDVYDANELFREQEQSKSPERAKGFGVGETGVNLVEGVALPAPVAIGLGAASSAGQTFEETGNLSKANVDFAKGIATNYAALKIGGSASKAVSKRFSPSLASDTSNLGKVAKVAGKATVGATSGVVGASVGGGVGAGLNTMAHGGNVTEIGKSMYEGATDKQNLTIGGVLGAKGGIKSQPKQPTKYDKTTQVKVDSQAQDYSKTSNSTQKSKVLDQSPHLQAHNEIQSMKENDIPIHGASFKGDKEAANMAGVKATNKPLSETELNTKVKDAQGNKTTVGEQITKGYKQFRDNTLTGVSKLKDNVASLNKEISSKKGNVGEVSNANQNAKAELTNYSDKLATFHKTMKDVNSTPEQIKQSAIEVDNAQQKLSDASKQSLSEISGGKLPDHIADAHNFIGVSNRVESALPGKKYAPSKTENLEDIAKSGISAVRHPIKTALKTVAKAGYQQYKQAGVREQVEAAEGSAKLNEGAVGTRATYEQRKQLQSMNHPEATNRDLTRQQAQELIQGRGTKEPEPQAPGEEKTPLERGAARQWAKSQNEALNKYRDQIHDTELKQKLSVEDLRDPTAFKEKFASIKKEDNSRNVEKIRKQNEIKATATQNTANVKHEAATAELARWEKAEGKEIPSEYIDQARKDVAKSTPEGERILDASRVKARAMKLFESKAGAGTTIKGNKAEFYHAIKNDLPEQVRDSARAHIDKAFGDKSKLTGDNLKQAWKDVYDIGVQHHGADTPQAKALKKLADRNVNTLTQRELSVQHEAIRDAMSKAITKTHFELGGERSKMSKEEQDYFIDHKMSELFEGRKESMTNTELKSNIQKMEEVASKQAKSWGEKSESQKAKDLGASEEHVAEIEANAPGKMSAKDSISVLTDIGNNYTDALRNGDIAKFRKTLESNKGIAHHLDKAGGNVAAYNRFETVVENVADRMESLPKGADSKALVSKEEYNSIVHNNVGYKDRLLDLAGVKDPKELLSESQRSKLEEDITSGKAGKREAIRKRGRGTTGVFRGQRVIKPKR